MENNNKQIEAIAKQAFKRKLMLDEPGKDYFFLRLVLMLERIQYYYNKELYNGRSSLLAEIYELLDEYNKCLLDEPDIYNYLRGTITELQKSERLLLERYKWKQEILSEQTKLIPTMISPDTMCYYKWLGRNYTGIGQAVELGCWMGSSTSCFIEGLLENPAASSNKLHVFDSFRWADWMTLFTTDKLLIDKNLKEGDSFLSLFQEYCNRFCMHMVVHECQLDDKKMEGIIPALEWSEGPVEILINDFSDEFSLTKKIWEVFSPHFIEGKTIVVFNQFGNARAESIRRFCREHAAELCPIHKPEGSSKSFIYTR